MSSTRNFSVELRKPPEPAPKLIDKVDRWSKIISIGLIPLVLGFIGHGVSSTIGHRGVDLEYVKTALSQLQNPNSDPRVKAWSTRVIDHYAEVKFDEASPGLSDALSSGDAKLSSSTLDDSWNVESPAHVSTWMFLLLNGELEASFPASGDIRMSQLKEFNPSSSDSSPEIKANANAVLMQDHFTESLRATYKQGVTPEQTTKLLATQLLNPDGKVKVLAKIVDGAFVFLSSTPATGTDR